jgi:hypothetical protein
MNNKKVAIWAVRSILMAIIVCWMITIFGFSSENGVQSQSFSDKITLKIVHFLSSDYDTMSLNKKQYFFNTVSFFVRKTGHFGEYGILGVLWIVFLMTFKKIVRLKYYVQMMIPTAICLFYAVTDEIHQSFVDGRSPQVRDVFIDMLGGLAGTLFVIIVVKLVFRRENELVGE